MYTQDDVKRAIAYGYELGCRATEGGTQDDPLPEAEAHLQEFLESLRSEQLENKHR